MVRPGGEVRDDHGILTHQAHACRPQDNVHGGPVLFAVHGGPGRHSQAHLVGHEAGALVAVVVSVHRKVNLNVTRGDKTTRDSG